MTLNVSAGTLTQPGATGNATISLSASFDPKAILMWTTGLPSPSGTGVNAVIGWGVGTYRGSVVQQGFLCHFWTDAAATMNVNSESGSDALLVLRPDGSAGARDLEIGLVSMASNNVVINWTNLHTTASIQINYMIFGGSDVTDALALTTRVAQTTSPPVTNPVTVATGFGKPAVVFMSNPGDVAGFVQFSKPSLGWGTSDTAQRYMTAGTIEGDTTAKGRMAQGNQMLEIDETVDTGSIVGTFTLSARSAWPTDGFELTLPASNSFADDFVVLALKGGANLGVTVASAVSPTVTGDQDLASGGTAVPKGIIIWGGNLPTFSGVDSTHADLLGWGIGASDMTAQLYAGMTDDDGLGTSDSNRSWSNGATWQIRGPSNALLAECTASVVGQAVRLTWTTVDATAREFNYVIFGETPAVPVFEEPNVHAWTDITPNSPLAT